METRTAKQKKHLYLLMIIFLFVSCIFFLISISKEKQSSSQVVDAELAQYSDNKKHNDFKIECEDEKDCIREIEEKNQMSQSQEKTPIISELNISDKEYGTWVWKSPIQMSETEIRFLVKKAHENNINVLYVTIDDVLDIYALENIEERAIQKKAYSEALQRVVRIAKEKGISVDAEAGWRDWAEADQKFKAFTIVDYVTEYNKTYTSYPLRGLQYDIEPYLLPSYEKNKGELLTNFVGLVDEITFLLGNSNLRLSIVIPHFYDDQQAWTPEVIYKGVTQHTFSHVIDILDNRTGSTIILMSYRNFAEGDNGTIQISEVEVREASNSAHRTKVIIGQETGKVDPEYVTYYGLSKEYYLEQIGIVQNRFKTKLGFGGMAVHYIEPFLELE